MEILPVDRLPVPIINEDKKTSATWNSKYVQLGAAVVGLAITAVCVNKYYFTSLPTTPTPTNQPPIQPPIPSPLPPKSLNANEELLNNVNFKTYPYLKTEFQELIEKNKAYEEMYRIDREPGIEGFSPLIFSIGQLEDDIKMTLSELDQCFTSDIQTCPQIAEQKACQPGYFRSWDIDYDATQGELQEKFLKICDMIKAIR